VKRSLPSGTRFQGLPGEQVLGYFSVSAKTSKRIYVDEIFSGLINPYKDCPGDTYMVGEPIPGLNIYRWIIEVAMGTVTTTWDHRCADCTVRGTTEKPEFWEDFK
jgi:hypothetical protein